MTSDTTRHTEFKWSNDDFAPIVTDGGHRYPGRSLVCEFDQMENLSKVLSERLQDHCESSESRRGVILQLLETLCGPEPLTLDEYLHYFQAAGRQSISELDTLLKRSTSLQANAPDEKCQSFRRKSLPGCDMTASPKRNADNSTIETEKLDSPEVETDNRPKQPERVVDALIEQRDIPRLASWLVWIKKEIDASEDRRYVALLFFELCGLSSGEIIDLYDLFGLKASTLLGELSKVRQESRRVAGIKA